MDRPPISTMPILRILATLGTLAVALGGTPHAAERESETRRFRILVDGKPAGEYHMVIDRADDGSLTMSGEADVRVRYWIVHYNYSYRGSETWKDGRLLRLESTANDDGKSSTTHAVAQESGLRVRAGGADSVASRDAWTSTYWCLPRPALRDGDVRILDADTGREIRGTIRPLGWDRIRAGTQTQNCAHYRVRGGVQVELWYDARERLVRQESVEDGHRTVLELTALER
jgi:hypothetical protein